MRGETAVLGLACRGVEPRPSVVLYPASRLRDPIPRAALTASFRERRSPGIHRAALGGALHLYSFLAQSASPPRQYWILVTSRRGDLRLPDHFWRYAVYRKPGFRPNSTRARIRPPVAPLVSILAVLSPISTRQNKGFSELKILLGGQLNVPKEHTHNCGGRSTETDRCGAKKQPWRGDDHGGKELVDHGCAD